MFGIITNIYLRHVYLCSFNANLFTEGSLEKGTIWPVFWMILVSSRGWHTIRHQMVLSLPPLKATYGRGKKLRWSANLKPHYTLPFSTIGSRIWKRYDPLSKLDFQRVIACSTSDLCVQLTLRNVVPRLQKCMKLLIKLSVLLPTICMKVIRH